MCFYRFRVSGLSFILWAWFSGCSFFSAFALHSKEKKNYSYKENRVLVAPALTSAKTQSFEWGWQQHRPCWQKTAPEKPGRDRQILYLLLSNNAAAADLALDFTSRWSSTWNTSSPVFSCLRILCWGRPLGEALQWAEMLSGNSSFLPGIQLIWTSVSKLLLLFSVAGPLQSIPSASFCQLHCFP